VSTVQTSRDELAARTIADAATSRGKELGVRDEVSSARRLFENPSVQVIPVLDGGRYVGAVDPDTVRPGIADRQQLGALARAIVPTCLAGTPASVALEALDEAGGQRLVVLGDDGESYVGLVCLRSDRVHLCVDAATTARGSSTEGETLMPAVSGDARVADLVLERPGRSRVFERFGIDYCCGGRKPLAAACAESGADLDEVRRALADPGPAEPEDVDWRSRPVSELCDHIVSRHHAYLRDELPPLRLLVDKVATAHGSVHPELRDVRVTFAAMADELEHHMVKEERVLFPACVALEEGDAAGFPFGSVQNPIGMMLHEHDEVAHGLSELRALTHGYEVPADACASYRSLLDRLHTLELDTHRHVHEENNVLFPRAIELEGTRG
jgi:regulator of cell morphogenesis and NO signaling